MPRSREEIAEEYRKFVEAHEKEFNASIASEMKELCFDLFIERQKAFVRKRINHMPDADIFAFCIYVSENINESRNAYYAAERKLKETSLQKESPSEEVFKEDYAKENRKRGRPFGSTKG